MSQRWEAPDTTHIRIVDTGYVDLPLPFPTSPGRRLTQRQHEDLAAGRHPLSRRGAVVELLPVDWAAEGGRPTPADRIRARPYTCGGCVFLVARPVGPRMVPKCGALDGARITAGRSSTVAKWWDACVDYVPVSTPPVRDDDDNTPNREADE